MFYIVNYIYRSIRKLYDEHKDPRVAHLPLVGSPFPPLSIIAIYLIFVLHWGPKWMRHRKPYNLKNILLIYNAIQVVANLFIFILGIANTVLRKEFSLTCQGVDHTNTQPWMQNLIYATYCYYLTKYLDLFDTIVFVLRKKNRQITFLHVYHHAGMVFGVCIHTTFLTGSHTTMLGIINLLIHTVMYGYYLATSIYSIKETLWWKRHITQLQLLQFVYLMLHFGMIIVNNHCQFPMFCAFVGLIQNLFMFVLFFDFYYKTYIRKPCRNAAAAMTKTTTQAVTKSDVKPVIMQTEISKQQVMHNGSTLKCS